MMENIDLRSESRMVTGKRVKQLRADGWIPAVVFGPDTPSRSIQIDQRQMHRVLQQAGSTALINLFVDDGKKPSPVLARDIQRDAVSGQLLHVDFYQVRLTEKVKTTPRLDIVGESPAVKSGLAVMIHSMTEVEVECLPTDLINSIPVDISGLETLDHSIVVGDLPIPESVTLLADPSDVVVSLVTTRAAVSEEAELEEAELEEEAEVDEEAEAEA
jgi:large subunit ribosomal protein L25